ncbi:SRPBCC family protein [Streptomyces krungchingensis]
MSRTLSVNDGTEPALQVDDIWAGLVDKAENPLAYVASMSKCSVTERFDGGLVREVVHAGQSVREVVTFYPKQRVHFVRTHGTAKGTIDNEISLGDTGELTLTFSFRIVLDAVEAGSAEEKELATRMEADYLDAVRTTLEAVRGRITGATTGITA